MGRIDLDATNDTHYKSFNEYIAKVRAERLTLILSDECHAILRPAVASKGIDSVRMINLNDKQKKELETKYNGVLAQIIYCVKYWWNDDVKDPLRAME